MSTLTYTAGGRSVCLLGGNGYIGSMLQKYLPDAKGIDIPNFDYWKIKKWSEADKYDDIILLAGHSSMPMGRDDPNGAWQNNVVNFKWLLDRLTDSQRLIYMSSASVYNGIKYEPSETCAEFHPFNMYDLTKYTIDQLATLANKHTYGLRLCTVNGFSPVLRVDLMLNKMVETVKKTGKIEVKNAKLKRPLTGINDVCRGIKAILDSDEDHRGIYNFCSLRDYTVMDYAQAVVDKFGGKVVDLGDEPHYVYGAVTWKFEQTYGFKFTETLDEILESLKQEPNEKVIRAIT